MKTSHPAVSRPRIVSQAIAISSVAITVLTLPIGSAHAQNVFTGADGVSPLTGGDPGAYDFSDGNNWTGGVPNLQTSGTTQINTPGATVDYYAGTYGDLKIGSGGTLEITNGTFDQVTSINWIQMFGNATILVDGGTFEQGSDTNNPFNLNGTTGNAFNITGGSAIFDEDFDVDTGFTYTQTGGTVTITGNELDYNSPDGTIIDGGVLNVNLITGVNSDNTGVLTIEGGTINLGSGGIYAEGSTTPVNFTAGSTGEVTFPAVDFSTDTLQGWINNGGFSYNGATDPSDLQVVSSGSLNIVEAIAPVPEPQTWAMFFGGIASLCFFRRTFRRK
ncbi:MAG TPA: PEP-CTERM sorting domain-containing protein [Chthoniobacteraceae bacterium]|jgi:hypothetical protein|nr:PEP-CTERM sorting domain-containing protein [Chthoniobacteraceae bacterium]